MTGSDIGLQPGRKTYRLKSARQLDSYSTLVEMGWVGAHTKKPPRINQLIAHIFYTSSSNPRTPQQPLK